MEFSKTLQKIGKFLVVVYLFLFPFGQLLKIGYRVNLGNLSDLVVLLTVLFYFFKTTKKPDMDKFVVYFLISGIFSLLISFSFFNFVSIGYGALYLLRLFSYYTLGVLVYNLKLLNKINQQFILYNLILASIVSALFGWIQYLFWPNLVFLKFLNWDDHLNRLVGTFYDPGFIGLILVLGSLLSLNLFTKNKNKLYLLYSLFLGVSVFFTYSRASFLALFVGLSVLVIKKQNFKKVSLLLVGLFVFLAVLLPKRLGEGNNLLRTASVFARFSNYFQTLEIVKKSPLFGVGLNNICAYRIVNFGETPSSHACSGTDSSLLFILATTGIVGFLIFINLVIMVLAKLQNKLTISILSAVFVHSLFSQSLFYSFIMGFLALYFGAVKLKE